MSGSYLDLGGQAMCASSEGPVKVTVSDPETGEVLAERVVGDDYVIVCAGRYYLHGLTTHANGTVVLTVKELP